MMGKGTATESFADVIARANQIPDDMGGASIALPENLFGAFPVPEGEQIVTHVPPGQKASLSTFPKYNFTAHFRRFIMGFLTLGDGDGDVISEPKDDSAEYEMLLNEMLSGGAILRWEDRTTLKDGTQVIAVCYLKPKKQEKEMQ